MKYVPLTLAAVAATTGIALGDGTNDDRYESLLREVESLRAEVAQLRSDDAHWLDAARESEIRGMVADVLSDADSRASLLQSGATAGYDNGFFIASSDGNFKLKVSGQLQVRYTFNLADQQPDQGGFEIRRAKLMFSGHVVDPSWQYKVVGAASRSTGAFALEDAYVRKSMDNGFAIKAGQFKAPLLREELVSSTSQLAVDRSLVNEYFNQGRSQGIQVEYAADTWRVMGMFHDGLNTVNTPWTPKTTEYAFAGRADILLMGDWSQFKDFSSPRGNENGFMVGVAANYQSQPYGTPGVGPENQQLRLTADADFQFDGGNVFGAFMYEDNSEGTMNPWAFVVQGGYFLTDDWEAFARYEYGDQDTAGTDELSIITIGANRYWNRHGLKWTTDVGFALNEVTSFWGANGGGVGWRTDAAGEDGQVVIRTQLQLLF